MFNDLGAQPRMVLTALVWLLAVAALLTAILFTVSIAINIIGEILP